METENVQNFHKKYFLRKSVSIKFYDFSSFCFSWKYCPCSIFNNIILNREKKKGKQPAANIDNNDPCASPSPSHRRRRYTAEIND